LRAIIGGIIGGEKRWEIQPSRGSGRIRPGSRTSRRGAAVRDWNLAQSPHRQKISISHSASLQPLFSRALPWKNYRRIPSNDDFTVRRWRRADAKARGQVQKKSTKNTYW
jgi:hypothetical protein